MLVDQVRVTAYPTSDFYKSEPRQFQYAMRFPDQHVGIGVTVISFVAEVLVPIFEARYIVGWRVVDTARYEFKRGTNEFMMVQLISDGELSPGLVAQYADQLFWKTEVKPEAPGLWGKYFPDEWKRNVDSVVRMRNQQVREVMDT